MTHTKWQGDAIHCHDVQRRNLVADYGTTVLLIFSRLLIDDCLDAGKESVIHIFRKPSNVKNHDFLLLVE